MTKLSSATRPLVLNAIPDLGAARPDFLDRALIVEFLDMKPQMRREEAQFWREFEEVRPRILGALLDAAAAGLKNLPNVRLEQPPRMADFALWVKACEESLGMKPGETLATYPIQPRRSAQSRSRGITGLRTPSGGGSGRIQRYLQRASISFEQAGER